MMFCLVRACKSCHQMVFHFISQSAQTRSWTSNICLYNKLWKPAAQLEMETMYALASNLSCSHYPLLHKDMDLDLLMQFHEVHQWYVWVDIPFENRIGALLALHRLQKWEEAILRCHDSLIECQSRSAQQQYACHFWINNSHFSLNSAGKLTSMQLLKSSVKLGSGPSQHHISPSPSTLCANGSDDAPWLGTFFQ
jgi:hypothetical protein